MFEKTNIFIERYQKYIPVALFVLSLAVSLPGVNWGVPALWNPDELIWRVDKALGGELVFDESEPDFNYPSLPKYVMFVIGKIVYALGYSQSHFIISARVFSALLGAIGIVLVYWMARTIGVNPSGSALAGLFCIASGVIPSNSRLAHNDIYLMFFSILCIFSCIKYQITKSRLWIYAAFLFVGMAASSKYTGGSLLLTPLFVFVILNWLEFRKDWLRSVETLFIGSILAFLGYGIGTPKALLWPAYYFKRVIPALEKLSLYSFNSGTPIGLLGQWGAFLNTIGFFLYFIFFLSIIWFVYKLLFKRFDNKTLDINIKREAIIILLVSLLFFDLPFLTAVHYLPRHFIPFIPFLAVLSAMFITEVYEFFATRDLKLVNIIMTGFILVSFIYSLLKLVSISLLYMNDARMSASVYIAQLPGDGKTIEYTLYPPIVNKPQFEKAHNYPIYFVKYPGETVPTGGRFEYNQGEQGLIDRDVDYLVIDTFTYSRLYIDSVCETNPVECDFFKRLLDGEVVSYHLVKEFVYSLPPWLPQVTINSVNPEIRIYERVE